MSCCSWLAHNCHLGLCRAFCIRAEVSEDPINLGCVLVVLLDCKSLGFHSIQNIQPARSFFGRGPEDS